MSRNEMDRLYNFRKATLCSDVFKCVSCQETKYQHQVVTFNENIRGKILAKFKNLQNCIANGNIHSFVEIHPVKKAENQEDRYLCSNCALYLKKGKLPPNSAKNGLELNETFEDMKKNNLYLTEFEASLVAPMMIFQKVMTLPKSRWCGIKDKMILIPIEQESINKTLTQLPRTPTDAGLLAVNLKRKMSYKNTHKSELIDPAKIYRFMEKCQEAGHPLYQDFNTADSYKGTCAKSQADFQLVFGGDSEDSDDDEKMETDLLKEEIEDKDFRQNDPVQKQHFQRNEVLAMTNKYPEINIAPGEGQTPQNILMEKDWELKCYPHLHNRDGTNSLDQERAVKLTPQKYIKNRLCNLDPRWANCKPWMFACVAYLELMQINRNINLVGTRGKKTIGAEGQMSYQLEDEYRALEGMANTPKYWKNFKYEVLSKLDNLGPFQFFFTLSCAEKRWNQNFARILSDQGCKVRYEVIKEDSCKTKIEVKKNADDKWKPIEEFLKDDVDESLHELIRQNVVSSTRYYDMRVKALLRHIVLHPSNPMKVKYYQYKVEFQNRGALHIHGCLWSDIKKIEKSDNGKDMKGLKSAFTKLRTGDDLLRQEREALKNFVDTYITVSTHKDKVGEDLAVVAREIQQHKCTACCRKYSEICRFGYPKLPSLETIITKPCKETGSKRQKKIEKHNTTLDKVRSIIGDEEAVKEIMENYDKQSETLGDDYETNRKRRIQDVLDLAEVSMDDYIAALNFSKQGCTIVLERDLDEIHVNPFNIEMLRAHDGNMDIQVCLDFFPIITYITDYLCKSDDELCNSIKAIMKNTDDKSVKERMRTLSNAFITHRSMGEAEAVVKILPSLNLANSNVTCQWVSIDNQSDRSSRWKKATEKEMESGLPVVQLENHEGYWYEQQDFYSKYLRRPDSLKDICLAQFAKMYRSRRVKEKDTEDDDFEVQDKDSDVDQQEDEDDIKFNFIMTYKKEGSRGTPLPDAIHLEDPSPGECTSMTRRKYPAALRFRQISEANNFEKYMYGELMLYHPHTEVLDDKNIVDLYNEKHGAKRKVDIVKSQVMEYLVDVQEARHFVDQAEKELNLEEIATQMDPNNEQDNAECQELGDEEHPDYQHVDPDLLDIPNETVRKGLYKRIEIPNVDELKRNTRALDEFQKEVLNIGIKYAKGCVKARRENNKAPTPPLLMVSGGAGSGKSTVIKTLSHWTQKILQKEGDDLDAPCVLKTSFCGTAASLIDGQTLHSAFSFSYSNKNLSLPEKSKMIRQKMLQNLKILIIDEISMVKSDMLYQLDFRLKEITGKMESPFGGVALFVFGDLMQLQPILGKYVFMSPKNPDLAPLQLDDEEPDKSQLWKKFQSIILEKNHRQGADKQYADMLNRIRIKKHTEEDITILEGRVRQKGHPDLKDVDFYICCKKAMVDSINTKYIAKLPGKIFRMKATNVNAAKKDFKPTLNKKDKTVAETGFKDVLTLKKDAKVLLIYNVNTMDGLTNGQLGTLEDFVQTKTGDIDMLVVKFRRPGIGESTRQKYPALAKKHPDCAFIERVSVTYNLNRRNDFGAQATVIQFPIVLAYGITVHKIQGGSIPSPSTVGMDIKNVFAASQAYVMMSRVQTLNQVFFIDEFVDEKIYLNKYAYEENQRLNQISLNRNRGPWDQDQKELFKIASLNCRGLSTNFEDIKSDKKLLQADVLMLQEISLLGNIADDDYHIDGFESKILPNGKGKGIALYFRPCCQFDGESYTGSSLQLAAVQSNGAKIVNVYRSNEGSPTVLKEKISQILTSDHHGVVMGDFNLCALRQKNNPVTINLENMGFNQKVTEPTHIQGRTIDHCYVKENEDFKMVDLQLHSPYYSDHDAILIVLQTVPRRPSRLTKRIKRN